MKAAQVMLSTPPLKSLKRKRKISTECLKKKKERKKDREKNFYFSFSFSFFLNFVEFFGPSHFYRGVTQHDLGRESHGKMRTQIIEYTEKTI